MGNVARSMPLETGSRLRSIHAAAVAIALIGCSKADSTDKPADQPTTDKASANPAKPAAKPSASKGTDDGNAGQPAPTPAKVAPEASAAGPAYIAVEGTGLVRVDHGKVKTLIRHDYTFYDLAIDHRAGTLYAAAIGGLWQIDGDDIAKLPQPDRIRNVEKLAVGPDGVLWGLDNGGVSRWDGKGWTREPAQTFEATLLGDITVDLAGRVWVITSNYVWRLDGDKWKRLDGKFAGTAQPFWKTIVAGPSGEVYLSGIPGAFVYEGKTWRKLTLSTGYSSPDELAIGADGRLAASGGVGDVALAAPGAAARGLDLASSGIAAHRLDVMAVDGRGRTWVKSDNGVVILDGKGKLLQQWKPGTVTGINGKIQMIAVAGGGPELPKLTEAAVGAVAGKVLYRGKPVAGAAVEICESPLTMFRTSPCDSATVTRKATTAADGSFTITNVSIGSYGFAIRPKSKWLVFIGSNACCQKLEQGQTYDIGSITVDRLQ